MTTLSDRLTAALVALEDTATDHTTAPGVLALTAAARAWTRVADEVDGAPSVDNLTRERDAAVDRAIEAERGLASEGRLITDLRADLATAERERDEARDLAEQQYDLGLSNARDKADDEIARLKARAEAAERERDETRVEIRGMSNGLDDLARDATKAYRERDGLKARAEAAERRLAEATTARWAGAPARCPVCEWTNTNLLNYGEVGKPRWMCHGCAARAIRGETPMAEASKPGPATDVALRVMWLETLGGFYPDPGPHAVKLMRAVYDLGRAEQAARVAELDAQLREAQAESSKWYKAAGDGIDAMAEHERKEVAAWQAATSAATPGEVRRLTETMLADAYANKVDWVAVEHGRKIDTHKAAASMLAALTAAGPVVLPAATPSDEEIARDLLRHVGAVWSTDEARREGVATLTAAVASVVRPLLARPAVEAFDLPALTWASENVIDGQSTDANLDVRAIAYNNGEWVITIEGTAKDGDAARATVERAHLLLTGSATARPAQTCPDCAAGGDAGRDGDLHHLAGPLPGADQAEALAIAYRKALGRAEVRSETEVAAMRRALLAVGATGPARTVSVEEIDKMYLDARPLCDTAFDAVRVVRSKLIGATITGGAS